MPISKPVVHQDVRLRVGAKVSERIGTKVSDRIGAKISENRATLVADREPQRSVKSRLSSPKFTPLRITPPTSRYSVLVLDVVKLIKFDPKILFTFCPKFSVYIKNLDHEKELQRLLTTAKSLIANTCLLDLQNPDWGLVSAIKF